MKQKNINPFSHEPGINLLVPLTPVMVTAYPTKLVLCHVDTNEVVEEILGWKGPVKGFTAQLHLDQSKVSVFAQTATGFKRVQILSHPSGIQLIFNDAAAEKIITFSYLPVQKTDEKLRLGCHRKPNWTQVAGRMDLQEILPIFFRLAQQMPIREGQGKIFNLLQISSAQEIAQKLELFFKVGFTDLLVPRLFDNTYQGIIEGDLGSGSALALFHAGYQFVRQLFFQETNDELHILPHLPSQFHAGRVDHLITSYQDEVSIYWVKKKIRQVIITPSVTREIRLIFPSSLASFRINSNRKRHLSSHPLMLQARQKLILDRFET